MIEYENQCVGCQIHCDPTCPRKKVEVHDGDMKKIRAKYINEVKDKINTVRIIKTYIKYKKKEG